MVYRIGPDEISEINEDQSLIIISFQVAENFFNFFFSALEELEIKILYNKVSITCIFMEEVFEERFTKMMLKAIIMKLIEFSIDVATLQISDCNLTQIILLVLHHWNHLLHRRCHVNMELLYDLQT